MREFYLALEGWWHGAGPWQHSLVVILVALAVHQFFRRKLLRWLESFAQASRNEVDDRLVDLLRQFMGLIILFVVVVIVLHMFSIQVTPLLAGAGIMGVALGLAAQETLSNLLAGVALIIDRPVRVGDRVKLDHIGRDWSGWGDVMDIGLRRTRVRNSDGVVVDYPNRILANTVIINFSREPEPVRVRFPIHVDYSADIDQVVALTLAIIKAHPNTEPDSAAVIVKSIWNYEQGHLGSGVVLEGRLRVRDVRTRTNTRSDILGALLKAFNEHGVPLHSNVPMTPLPPKRASD